MKLIEQVLWKQLYFKEVSKALAAFYRNKQAARCRAGKPYPCDSDVIIETNNLPLQHRFDYCGNWAGALDTALF